MRRLIDRLQAAALLTLGAVTFVYFGPAIDKLFPVIDPFVVASKRLDGDRIVIAGWLHKRRDCAFIEATGRAIRGEGLPAVVPFVFLESDRTYTRPTGAQEWGPWYAVVPAGTERVIVTAMHDCHPLWMTRSELAIVELYP